MWLDKYHPEILTMANVPETAADAVNRLGAM
jgi:hypothetical protein